MRVAENTSRLTNVRAQRVRCSKPQKIVGKGFAFFDAVILRLFVTRGFPPTRTQNRTSGSWFFALAPVHPRCSRRLRTSYKNTKPPAVLFRDWGLTPDSVFPMDCYLLSLFCFGYPPELVYFPFHQTLNLTEPHLHSFGYSAILGSTLTQACLERSKCAIHFAFPNSEKFGCLFGPLSFTGPYLVSTWDSPFLSDCILLYLRSLVNIFLAVLYKKFTHAQRSVGEFT